LSIRKTIFDSMSMSSVGVLRLLAQFMAIPILARILSPADYGIVAIAFSFVMFANMIADAGISMSLVRTPIENRKEWSTCFWLSLILGVVLTLIMLASAPFVAMLFEEKELSHIIMALSAVILMQSIGSVYGAAMIQAEKFKLIAISETIAILTSIGVAVLTAQQGFGAWALVFQQLSLYLIRMTLTLLFSPLKPQKILDIKNASEHIRFARDILSFNIISFLTRSLDNLIIGKVMDTVAVGIYSMAFQFARLPMTILAGPIQSVFYSKMAKVKDDKDAIRKIFLIITRTLATIIFPSMGMVAVAHNAVFTLVLSDKWQDSGRIFMLVAAVTALQAVMNLLCNTVRMALGHTGNQVRQTIEQGAIWIITMFSTIWFGLDVLVISYSIVFLLYSPRILMLTLPFIDCSFKDYIKAIATPIVITIMCIMIYIALQDIFHLSIITQFLTAAALTISGILASLLLQYSVLHNEYRLMKNNSISNTNKN
jgi:O-antigen/teichoic acid export membrane protein